MSKAGSTRETGDELEQASSHTHHISIQGGDAAARSQVSWRVAGGSASTSGSELHGRACAGPRSRVVAVHGWFIAALTPSRPPHVRRALSQRHFSRAARRRIARRRSARTTAPRQRDPWPAQPHPRAARTHGAAGAAAVGPPPPITVARRGAIVEGRVDAASRTHARTLRAPAPQPASRATRGASRRVVSAKPEHLLASRSPATGVVGPHCV
jgi:hypothetical protein